MAHILSFLAGPSSFAAWPALNAALNGFSAALLVLGFISIRAGNRGRHRKLMIAAFGSSTMFLGSYLVYHSVAGIVRFQQYGWIRAVYFTLLTSHTILAAAVPVLAVIALALALRSRFDRHRRVARWALPIWLYVSVTGVVVYLMLYHLPG